MVVEFNLLNAFQCLWGVVLSCKLIEAYVYVHVEQVGVVKDCAVEGERPCVFLELVS